MIGNLDPKKVTITVGSRFLTGFAPDGIFNRVYTGDRVTYTSGSQGDGVYVENPDESAILTVTLLPTSPSNAYLADLCARRIEEDVTVNDASEDARMTEFSSRCRVQKFSDASRNLSAPTGTWNIIMPKIEKI